MSISYPSQQHQQQGWLQGQFHSWGSMATSSKPAYALATLFAIATPFGFASPEQIAAETAVTLQRERQAAQMMKTFSSQGSSSFIARLVANAKVQKIKSIVRPFPPFWQLAGFAALFATGGYMIDQGDSLNGSGVITAWSLTYLFFRTIPTIKKLPKNPLAMALSVGVVTLGLGIHGSHYFDRASWQGAAPMMFSGQSTAENVSKLASFADQSLALQTLPATHPSNQAQVSSPPLANNDRARMAAFLKRQATI